MDCSHANSWTAAQVKGAWEEAHPLVKAWVDRRPVTALLNLSCMRMLVQQAKGSPLDIVLMVHCIHGDIHPYHQRWDKVVIEGDCQFLRAGVAPHLQYGAVIGRDWPNVSRVLAQVEAQEGLWERRNPKGECTQ